MDFLFYCMLFDMEVKRRLKRKDIKNYIPNIILNNFNINPNIPLQMAYNHPMTMYYLMEYNLCIECHQ